MAESRSADYDAIVIGGGPAGPAYAIAHARGGHSVLMLEREAFPRFRIGESLLTCTAEVLDQFGVFDQLCQVELTSTKQAFRRLDLREIGPLLEAATDATGITALQQARVTGLMHSGNRVSGVRYKVGETEHSATARFVIDASGMAGLVVRALKLRKTGNDLKMAAVFKHVEGVGERNNPATEGDIQLEVHEDGFARAVNGDFWSSKNEFFNRLRAVPQRGLFESFEPLYKCPVYAGD